MNNNKNTFIDERTPEEVKQILLSELNSNNRLRLFFGDVETGKDWNEEHDTIGYIRCSTGETPILLLINNKRSSSGGAILTHCIIKIIKGNKVLYQNPKYNCGKFYWELESIEGECTEIVYKYKDDGNSDWVAKFKKAGQAKRWIDFITGKRNNK